MRPFANLLLTCLAIAGTGQIAPAQQNQSPITPVVFLHATAANKYACCPATEKFCVPEVVTKTKTTFVYGSKTVDFCLPQCSLLGLFGHSDCNCANCGQPQTKKVLLKRAVTCDEETIACHVEERLACPPVICPATISPQPDCTPARK